MTGYAGIEAAKATQPRLILLDIGLPDISGYETCRLLRRIDSLHSTIIVAQSGLDDGDAADAKEAGFDRFIVKPAPIELLDELIASVVAGDMK